VRFGRSGKSGLFRRVGEENFIFYNYGLASMRVEQDRKSLNNGTISMTYDGLLLAKMR
jgi:hypothetical protein